MKELELIRERLKDAEQAISSQRRIELLRAVKSLIDAAIHAEGK